MSADSIAMSLPLPTAQPTSASDSAGASFMPSPTIITGPYFCLISVKVCALLFGNTSEYTSSAPASFPIYSAQALLSPERITVLMPSFLSRSKAAREESFISSATAISPITLPLSHTYITDFPSSEKRAAVSSYFDISAPLSLIKAELPKRIFLPFIPQLMPLPGISSIYSGS